MTSIACTPDGVNPRRAARRHQRSAAASDDTPSRAPLALCLLDRDVRKRASAGFVGFSYLHPRIREAMSAAGRLDDIERDAHRMEREAPLPAASSRIVKYPPVVLRVAVARTLLVTPLAPKLLRAIYSSIIRSGPSAGSNRGK
jgi:hypothetical protein